MCFFTVYFRESKEVLFERFCELFLYFERSSARINANDNSLTDKKIQAVPV
jgi:hypothetical protein